MFFRCDFFFFSSRRRHTRCSRDWSSDVCSSDLTLSFLGLGFPPDIPTWGRILFDAKANLDFALHWAIFPGTAIFLTVLSIIYIGDGLRDALALIKVLERAPLREACRARSRPLLCA